MIVGIDLGTTNSLIGILERGRPKLFKDDSGNCLIPSIVALSNDGALVVGNEAKVLRDETPQRSIYSAKRFMGRGLSDVGEWLKLLPFDFSPSDERTVRFKLGETNYNPTQVGAMILKKLKSIAEKESNLKIDKAVVTVPAYFNDTQRQATKLAAELAGLEVVRIINEPTAACLAYGLDKKTQGLIAVFDLGGGTFDISILRVADGVFEVLATNGDTTLGGDDFDSIIAKALEPQIAALTGKSPSDDKHQFAELVLLAEKLKIELSSEKSGSLEWRGNKIAVSRAQMESWISSVVERAVAPCLQCLKDASLETQKITDVILVGGSTRVPLVRAKVKELFHREPICSLNPDEVVAIGAAVQGNILSGHMTGMLLLDVIPLSLGIETMGGVVGKIIHRNSTIPISAAENYTTYVDGQVSVDIHVLQGERELVKDNRSLARFQLKGIPPLPAGVPKIEVEFIIDANGILSIRATELRTGVNAEVQVNPSFGLTDTEVEKMLSDSFEFAESDFEARFLIEARVEADSLIRATRKSLDSGREILNSESIQLIVSNIEALEESTKQNDRHLIKKQIEVLNESTKSFAEMLMNRAVRDALKDKKIGETL